VPNQEAEETVNPARVELAEANAFVSKVHRHHGPVRGHRFSIACQKNGQVVGVAICGRPVARGIPQKTILEVLRCATDGTRNACSYLYAKAARVATELGFVGVITYTLTAEEGASLRACGWWPEALPERDTHWNCTSRPRETTKGQGLGQKVRWLWLTGVAQ
jgi:hypothetical protein